MSGPEQRLRELGWELPQPAPPAGTYQPWTRAGDLLYLAGQVSTGYKGRLGADVDPATGRLAARAAMLNLLAQTHQALGSLDRVGHIVKVTGFVCCTSEFTGHSAVIDGATELLTELFGQERGRPARSAVGVAALPFGFAVELEMIVAT
jgi:enamine deaminase RidA (YjgF/YER057c/UK114 family)